MDNIFERNFLVSKSVRESIIVEIATTRATERCRRADDKRGDTSAGEALCGFYGHRL